MNIRSLPKHIDSLECYLNNLEHTFTVIGLSETWISEENASFYKLSGYKNELVYRTSRSGGGVSLHIKENLSYVERTDLNVINEYIEFIFIEVDKIR